ncbi:MAG: hypothetical protein Q7T38_09460 [Gallionella sp.]|nr:hypothetical protein [Gallionella sp.]
MNLLSDQSLRAYSPAACLQGIARVSLRLELMFLVRVVMVLVLTGLCISASWAAQTTPYKLDIGRGGQCVKDPQWMRKNHMHLLKHQRDETVHKGIRDDQISLKNCIECHASLKDDSVIARDDSFCVACHRYEAVKIDCFECHSGTRKSAWLLRNAK